MSFQEREGGGRRNEQYENGGGMDTAWSLGHGEEIATRKIIEWRANILDKKK